MMIDDNFEIAIMMITLIDDEEEEDGEDWWQMHANAQWHPQDMWMYLELHPARGPKVCRLRKDAAGESKKSPTLSKFHVEGMIMAWYDHGMIWHENVRRNKLNLMMFSENDMM